MINPQRQQHKTKIIIIIIIIIFLTFFDYQLVTTAVCPTGEHQKAEVAPLSNRVKTILNSDKDADDKTRDLFALLYEARLMHLPNNANAINGIYTGRYGIW
jgi:hypothetical protein